MSLTIASGRSRATIAPQGAELRSWSVGGHELMWTPDAAIWADVAPILFPVVGWTRDARIRVDGTTYPLGLHGFARTMAFDVLAHGPDYLRLGLTSSDVTRALYPFDWGLTVDYRVDDTSITTRLTVRNAGACTMPYACGLHPGFRWPFAGGDLDDYTITFGEREQASVPIISPQGLFTHQRRSVPLDGRRLALSAPLLEAEALCFLDAASDRLRFAHASGAAIDIVLEDFPHIALWSRPAGRFLSIEAWTGHGDFIDADGDLFAKPSMRHLPPNAQASHGAQFSYAAPHVFVGREEVGSLRQT